MAKQSKRDYNIEKAYKGEISMATRSIPNKKKQHKKPKYKKDIYKDEL